jgi:hypothetical protein
MEHRKLAFSDEVVLFAVSFQAVRRREILLDLLDDEFADFVFFHT